jgi:hypothetical protein
MLIKFLDHPKLHGVARLKLLKKIISFSKSSEAEKLAREELKRISKVDVDTDHILDFVNIFPGSFEREDRQSLAWSNEFRREVIEMILGLRTDIDDRKIEALENITKSAEGQEIISGDLKLRIENLVVRSPRRDIWNRRPSLQILLNIRSHEFSEVLSEYLKVQINEYLTHDSTINKPIYLIIPMLDEAQTLGLDALSPIQAEIKKYEEIYPTAKGPYLEWLKIRISFLKIIEERLKG